MHDLGINIESFNPKVFYTLKKKFTGESDNRYHCHDFISLIYVLAGSCTYIIAGESYQVKKGDMIVCNPGVYHGKVIASGEEITEFQAGLSNICIEGLPRNCIISADTCPVFGMQGSEQEMLRCCSDIFLEQENKGPGCALMLKIHVMRLVTIFLKATNAATTLHDTTSFNFETNDRAIIVNTLISFINENYMRDISLDTISKNVYLSPAYISKVFREEMDESPINYLIKMRLSKARELLEEGKLTVKAAAKTVGYDDAYYFSKLYKKYYDISPSTVRKKKASPK